MTYALRGVISGGTGSAASIYPIPTAGKTGTANENVDAWFCGYTTSLVTCVWMGWPEGEIPLEDIHGVSTVYGGTIPAAIWHDFMVRRDAEPRVRDFADPSFEGYTIGPETPVPIADAVSDLLADPRARRRSPRPSPTPSPTPTPTPPRPSPTPSPTGTPKQRLDSRVRPRSGHVTVTVTESSGIVAMTAVPRPGVERTANDPLASSTRSRIDASPTRPLRRKSRACPVSKPVPSSSTSIRSCSCSDDT